MIFKAEVVQLPGREPKDNVRFVVTNLRPAPERVYRIYTQRGDPENRIKELKNDLAIDRTSCSRFLANQLRVLLTAAAYVVMQELRQQARSTECRRAQVATLRERLCKLAAWVEVSVRRVVVHLFHRCLLSLGNVEPPTRGSPRSSGDTTSHLPADSRRRPQTPPPYDAY